ncbi:MAG: hypothetical protein KA285_04225 [Bacteroidia bacterium]|nr:hypothetical protein [Bacteroidia bacterium]
MSKQTQYIKDWLISNLEALEVKKVTYEYHEYSNTHCLLFQPEVESLNDEQQLLFVKFISNFENTFIDESILLLDKHSLTQIDSGKVLYERKEEIFSVCDDFYFPISEQYLNDYTYNQGNAFYKYHKEIIENKWLSPKTKYKLKNIESGIDFSPSIFFEIKDIVVEMDNSVYSENVSYSLAA